MRVKLLTRGAGPQGPMPPGTVIEMADEEAFKAVVARRAIYTLEAVTASLAGTLTRQLPVETATSRASGQRERAVSRSRRVH